MHGLPSATQNPMEAKGDAASIFDASWVRIACQVVLHLFIDVLHLESVQRAGRYNIPKPC